MEKLKLNQEWAKKLKGSYVFRSPYHKSKKMLPFTVLGTVSFNDEFPIEVNTVEYKGWKPEYIHTSYSVETITRHIKNGTLIKNHQ